MTNEQDSIQHFIFDNKSIRGILVRLDQSLQTIMQQHEYPTTVNGLLAECLAATALMMSTVKFKGKLIVQLQNQGAISLLVTKCNDQLGLSGLAKWDETVEIKDLESTLDQGKLVMTFLQDNKTEPYQSIVPIQQQTVAGALEDYFVQSEQLPTKFWIKSNGKQAIGMLLQLLPEQDAEITTDSQDFYLETAKFADQDITEQFDSLDNEALLQQLFSSQDIRLFEQKPVSFHCDCSLERMQNAIITLGKEEAYDILNEKHSIQVSCDFCAKAYDFTRGDVDTIFESTK
ncbi:MAG: Hsp33 family molecular chaperone HslO [Coxiellaceae bacterium]|nr:Hsp33 family molecular chaperone HslO [Coxiellaceae bacterium]